MSDGNSDSDIEESTSTYVDEEGKDINFLGGGASYKQY